MPLTLKQETFAQKVGCEGLSLTDAYKQVYDCSKSLPDTISKNASSLARGTEVAARIQELRGALNAAAVKRAKYTLEHALKDADEAIERARAIGKPAELTSAMAHKAKLAGLMVEKREIRTGALDDTEAEELEQLLKELRARRVAQSGQAEVDDRNRPSARPS